VVKYVKSPLLPFDGTGKREPLVSAMSEFMAALENIGHSVADVAPADILPALRVHMGALAKDGLLEWILNEGINQVVIVRAHAECTARSGGTPADAERKAGGAAARRHYR
jgi:hypothetical protein